MSTKRELQFAISSVEQTRGTVATSLPNKRMKTISTPAGSKRATRASTGAPVALTAKGTLYQAHKDIGAMTESLEASSTPCVKFGPNVHIEACGGDPANGFVAEPAAPKQEVGDGVGSPVGRLGGSSCNGMINGHPGVQVGGVDGETGSGKRSNGGNAAGTTCSTSGASSEVPGGGEGGDAQKMSAALPSEGVEDGPSVPRRRRGRKGRSIYRGVCVTREGKWRAVIYKERKQLYLGVYESELEAAKAHDRAARFHFPDKAMTNFESEDDANRLLASEERQRQLQQGVDRDLAPLRRLGGRGLNGYPEVTKGGESVLGDRSVKEESIRRDCGASLEDLSGSSSVAVQDAVDGAKAVGHAWSDQSVNKELGGYRSGGATCTLGEYTAEMSNYLQMRGGGRPGPSYSMDDAGEGKVGRRSSSGALVPNEPHPRWWSNNISSAANNDHIYYDREHGYQATDIDRDTVLPGVEKWKNGTVSLAAGSHPTLPRPESPRLSASGERKHERVGDGGSGEVSGNGWGGSARAIRGGLPDRGNWAFGYQHDPGALGGVVDGTYQTEQRGGQSVGSRPGDSGATSERDFPPVTSAEAVVSPSGESGGHWVGGQRYLSGKIPTKRTKGNIRHPIPDGIGTLEEKIARVRQEDEETAAAAEAAMVMAGYGRGLLGRETRSVTEVSGQGASEVAAADVVRDRDRPDDARRFAPSANPRYRRRPEASAGTATLNDTRWDVHAAVANGDSRQGIGKLDTDSGDGLRQQSGGRGYLRQWPDTGAGAGAGAIRDREWRGTGVGFQDGVYSSFIRGMADDQVRTGELRTPSRKGEAVRGESAGTGAGAAGEDGFDGTGPSHPKTSVGTVAATDAVLKYSHGDSSSRNEAPGLTVDVTSRWSTRGVSRDFVDGRGENGGDSENGYMKNYKNSKSNTGDKTLGALPSVASESRGVLYPRNRPVLGWSKLGAVTAAAASRSDTLVASQFSTSYHAHNENSWLPQDTVVGIHPGYSTTNASVDIGLATSSLKARGQLVPGLSPAAEPERERLLCREKYVPHDMYRPDGAQQSAHAGTTTGARDSGGREQRSAIGLAAGPVANGGDTFRRLGSHVDDQDTPKYPAGGERAVVGIPTCNGMTGTADNNRGISTNSNSSSSITMRGISRNGLGVAGANRAGVENPVAKDGRMSSQGLVQRC